jgi:hypothetical protein
MFSHIFTVLNEKYDEWNIQFFVLLSLLLQAILILVAPFRKRAESAMLLLLIWSAYILAIWTSNFTVGLISSGKKNPDCSGILAFWAPFLLLHLGGPDTITAVSLEDNALWLRQLVGLLGQFVLFGQSFSQYRPTNKLWLPTFLLFLAGTIKYGERTRALYLANLKNFRKSNLTAPDPGPNYAKLMEEYASKKEARLPTQIEKIREPNQESKTSRYVVEDKLVGDLAAVKHAYHFFKIFQGLIVDIIFSFREREESRQFFQKRDSEDAFKVLAIELNFFYELLYTKVIVLYSMLGYSARCISWCAVVAAISTFYSIDKSDFRKIDVGITYTLLFGAIFLDTIALFMMGFSDWVAASLQESSRQNFCIEEVKRCWRFLLGNYLRLKRINWQKETSRYGRGRQILFQRWSEYLRQYNLIHYCLKERHRKINGFFSHLINFLERWDPEDFFKNMYEKRTYVSKKPFTKPLWDFIFEELKKKSYFLEDPESDLTKRIYSARGEWVLKNADLESSKLMHYIVDVKFDQSLILWHIATELCYQKEKEEIHGDSTYENRQFCKEMSDYMLYLLVMEPTTMSAEARISEVRLRDTCAEAKDFFKRKLPDSGQEQSREHKEACEKILEVNTEVEPVAVKGDKSKSVLFDACILAKEILNLEVEKRWCVMSEVWVEMLSYAASHCKPNVHAAQLNRGGELLTFVWLLMAHFGLGDQFQRNTDGVRAKLIVGI